MHRSIFALFRFAKWRKTKNRAKIVGYLQAQQELRKLTRFVDKVFIHCSDSDHDHHDDIRIVRGWHFHRGFDNVGYHFFIRKNGQIQIGRAVNNIPAAQKGFNRGSLAICLSGKSKFSKAQFRSLQVLCRYIKYRFYTKGLPISFHGHCEVNKAKTCPNFDYTEILNLNSYGRIKK